MIENKPKKNNSRQGMDQTQYGTSIKYLEPEYGVSFVVGDKGFPLNKTMGSYEEHPEFKGRQLSKKEYEMKRFDRKVRYSKDFENERDIKIEITSINLENSMFLQESTLNSNNAKKKKKYNWMNKNRGSIQVNSPESKKLLLDEDSDQE